MNYPQTIKNTIDCFKKLPGIGEKTAERLALSLLNQTDEMLSSFSTSVLNIKKNTKKCSICNSFSENDICDICSDVDRNQNTICVVENPKNVILLEKVGTYNGAYHVLNGLISPLDGITPDDINLEQLIKRIDNNDIKEVIIALKPSIEGETTSLYISKILEDKKVLVSKIAHGIPLGADMDYIDPLTLELALENRKKLSE